MAVTQLRTVRHVEPGIVSGEVRVRADVRENREDKFIRKFEDCRNGMEQISIRFKGPTREVALGLVWGVGDGLGRFPLKLWVTLASNVKVFSR